MNWLRTYCLGYEPAIQLASNIYSTLIRLTALLREPVFWFPSARPFVSRGVKIGHKDQFWSPILVVQLSALGFPAIRRFAGDLELTGIKKRLHLLNIPRVLCIQLLSRSLGLLSLEKHVLSAPPRVIERHILSAQPRMIWSASCFLVNTISEFLELFKGGE